MIIHLISNNMTIEQFGARVKAKYPVYSDMSDAELGRRVLAKYPVYKDWVEDQGYLQKLRQTAKTNLSAFIQPAIGAGKGALETLSGISKWGQKGLQAVTPAFKKVSTGKEYRPEIVQPPAEWTESRNLGQSMGKFAEHTAEYMLPGALGMKAAKGAGYLALGATEGLTSAGVSALQAGELNRNVAWTGALGAALPMVGKAIGSYLSPQRLMGKAVGLPAAQINKLDDIAKTTNRSTGKPDYTGFKDWALQKFNAGSRQAMADQADDLYKNTLRSKADILKLIKNKAPNEYSNLLDFLASKYSTIGNEGILKEIIKLKTFENLTVSQLDRIRFLADNVLPRGAYSGAEPAATEGLQRIINRLRDTVAGFDKTGQIAKQNTDIRILHKLITGTEQWLKKAAKKEVLSSAGVKGVLGSGATYLTSLLVPQAAPAMAALGASEMALSFPQVSSTIARTIARGGKYQKPLRGLTEILKAAAKAKISAGKNITSD